MIDQNLTLTGYGVTLRRLTHDKIEKLRQWRNDPKIQQYMNYREYITSEMQERWFHTINNDNNLYFIIEFEGKEVGMINIKDIDYERKKGERGIFIYDDDYLNSFVSTRASMCLSDFIYNELQLKETYGHILQNNKRSIRMSKFMGAKLAQGQDDVDNQLYITTKEAYESIRPRITRILQIEDGTIK
jgi:RimJ/RimL family protein N-acetyltransferase